MATLKSERQELKRVGAKPTRNSGRNNWEKGDGHINGLTVDVKEYKVGYSLNKKNWAKICTDAAKNGEEPALLIVLGEGKEVVRLWVFGDDMARELLKAYGEANG